MVFKPTILVTGRNGQVGFELQRALAPLGRVIGVGRSECDISDAEALRKLVRHLRPDIIVNPAAYTAVDRAEVEREAAFAVNAKAVQILGEEADTLGSLLVHYSTDYVFDGTKHGPYVEHDSPSPSSVYGHSKLSGERLLCSATSRYIILRTSWVVGAHGNNFAKTILRLASEREELKIVSDQFGAPTSAALLADLTAHLVRQYQRENSALFPYGTYHVTSSGSTNWCDYARFIIEEAIGSGKKLKTDPESVVGISSEQYSSPARRPKNSCLDSSHFCNTFGLHLPSWQEDVRQVLQQIF